jgi:zinc transporter ZupT
VSPLALSVIFGLLAGLANVTGGFIVTRRAHWSQRSLSNFIAVGAGFMLAAASLRMGFAAVTGAEARYVPLLILVGYFLVHLFSQVFSHHFHLSGGREDCTLSGATGFTALAGLVPHTLFDGVAIGAGFQVDVRLGLLIFFAILLHKIPEGFTVSSIMLGAGMSKGMAMAASAGVALSTVAGTLLVSGLARFSHEALAISAGVLVYVAASELIPELSHQRRVSTSLLVVGGAALFLITEQLLEHAGL